MSDETSVKSDTTETKINNLFQTVTQKMAEKTQEYMEDSSVETRGTLSYVIILTGSEYSLIDDDNL